MFLVVTPLREFWDEDDELLFIGPWCVPFDRRGELEGRRHRFLADPWNDHDRFIAGVAACRETTESLLLQLVPYLNEIHGVSYDARSWRVLLNPWLAHHIQQMYSHWTHLQDALASEPGLRTAVLDPAQYETPRDTEDFIRLSFSDRYQLQMHSILLEALRPGLERRRAAAPASPGKKPASNAGFLRRAAARALALLVPPGAGTILAADLNLRRAENLGVYRAAGLKILPYLAQLPPSLAPAPRSDARRLGLAGLKGRGAFEKTLIAALPTHFPTLYLEGFRDARRYAAARVWRTPKAIFSSVGWHYNEALKFAAAEFSSRGSELWGLQHGGVYGLWEHADGEYFERSVTDRFYCWGWAELARDPKVRDLPHPMFAREASGVSGEDVVAVSTVLDYYDIRLTRPQRSEQAFDYIERQARLWRGVSRELPGRAFYRMSPTDLGWCERGRLAELCPEVRFDDSSKPFSERARSARLLIFDNPITTFLEAMGADLPCLLTWNPDIWRFRPEAQPYLDALEKAGIYFADPEAAVRQAAAIHADPRAWWNEPKRRAAHRAFAERFALSRADWLTLWMRELR